jgi:DnaJ-class molecular chaperone
MENFYKLFNISTSSSLTEIMAAYQRNISKYNNLPFITDDQSKKIKDLKKGLYILTNPNLKKIYDEKLYGSIENKSDEIKCANSVDDDTTLDSLFSSKTLLSTTLDSKLENNKLDNNILGDRIFSLSHMNRTPKLDDFSLELRKPLTGRQEKLLKD